MIDLERIKALYKLGSTLQMKDVTRLVSAASLRTYQPKEFLIEAGETRKRAFFIQKGLVRVFMLMESGVEKTLSLQVEPSIIASPDLYLHDQPSRFYFQALESTTTFSLDDDILQSIITNIDGYEQHRKNIHLRMLKEAQTRIESFVLYSPEERYLQYVKEHPEIMRRAPDKYIANVLGITPVSLSRIRARVFQKKHE